MIELVSIVVLGLAAITLAVSSCISAARRDRMLERLLHSAMQHISHDLAVKQYELDMMRAVDNSPRAVQMRPPRREQDAPPPGISVDLSGPGPDG